MGRESASGCARTTGFFGSGVGGYTLVIGRLGLRLGLQIFTALCSKNDLTLNYLVRSTDRLGNNLQLLE